MLWTFRRKILWDRKNLCNKIILLIRILSVFLFANFYYVIILLVGIYDMWHTYRWEKCFHSTLLFPSSLCSLRTLRDNTCTKYLHANFFIQSNVTSTKNWWSNWCSCQLLRLWSRFLCLFYVISFFLWPQAIPSKATS